MEWLRYLLILGFSFFLTYNPTSVISSATVTQDFTGQLVNPAFLMIKLPNVNHHFSWWNSVIKLPPISADSHPSRACVAQASCGARWTHHVQGFSVWLMWLGAINHPPVITILYGFHNPQMVGLWFMVYSVYHMIYIVFVLRPLKHYLLYAWGFSVMLSAKMASVFPHWYWTPHALRPGSSHESHETSQSPDGLEKTWSCCLANLNDGKDKKWGQK